MGTYRIWVRGRDAGGVTTPWLNMTEILIVAPPSATGPASATFNRRPTFTWTGVAGAQTYELRLVNEVNGVVTTQTGLTTTSWTPPSNLADGPYRWQVLAQSPSGIRSLWSTAQPLFIGGRPTVTVPSGVSGNQPNITWASVGGAVRYELWIDRVGVQSVISRGISLQNLLYACITAADRNLPSLAASGEFHRADQSLEHRS